MSSTASLEQVRAQALKIVEKVLGGQQYDVGSVSQWADDISSQCVNSLSPQRPNFKITATTMILQRKGAGVTVAAAAALNVETDGSFTPRLPCSDLQHTDMDHSSWHLCLTRMSLFPQCLIPCVLLDNIKIFGDDWRGSTIKRRGHHLFYTSLSRAASCSLELGFIRMLERPAAGSWTPTRGRNIVALLDRRACGLPCRGLKRQLTRWAERKALDDGGGGYMRLPRSAKSTIAIAVAPDGRTFACTHGDHTVKIVSYGTGRVLRTLVGHPRTPWSVKFHPTNPRILASGCIGCEVRIWDAETGACLHRACLPHAIISLSFHPSGTLLAIASGPWLYLWDYHRQPEPYKEWDHDHIIRCVHFHPSGAALIMGAANSPPHARPQLTGTFRLVIWAFDARVARTPKHLRAADSPGALSRPRWLLDHALLYNDGGLDLSPCGRYLISCADLPRPGSAAETASPCVLLLPPSAQTHARPHPVSPPTAPYLVLLKFDHLREPTMGGLSMIAAKPLERVLARCPSDFAGVTSVKFSPSGAFCILGYGVRRGGPAAALTYMHSACHAAAAVFSTDDLTEVTSLISTEDDVNIARFHPFSGYGLLYGTKQGRVRVRGPGLLLNTSKQGVGYDAEQSASSEMSV